MFSEQARRGGFELSSRTPLRVRPVLARRILQLKIIHILLQTTVNCTAKAANSVVRVSGFEPQITGKPRARSANSPTTSFPRLLGTRWYGLKHSANRRDEMDPWLRQWPRRAEPPRRSTLASDKRALCDYKCEYSVLSSALWPGRVSRESLWFICVKPILRNREKTQLVVVPTTTTTPTQAVLTCSHKTNPIRVA
jgi:hypothetical protein